jgi:hypothetical protein
MSERSEMLRRLARVVGTRASAGGRHGFVRLRVEGEPTRTQKPREVVVTLRRLAIAVRASRCSQPRTPFRARICVLRAIETGA